MHAKRAAKFAKRFVGDFCETFFYEVPFNQSTY